MKRIHVHVAVRNLEESVRFYSTLFGVEPVVRKADYAKWMLDDPYVNFAMTERQNNLGIDHFGIQLETSEELQEAERRLQAAGRPVEEADSVHCCYSQLEQTFTVDPQGVNWEAFRTVGPSPLYCDSKQLFRSLEFQSKAAASQESCCE